MRHFAVFLTASLPLTLALSVASPQSYSAPLTPANTTITYYTGSTDAATCAYAVGADTLPASKCTELVVSGVRIASVPKYNCTATLWYGSSTCSGGAAKTVAIPAGNESACVGTTVLDGGKWQHASLVWSCL